MAIYVKFMTEDNKPDNVRDFLKKFYSFNVDPYMAKACITFSDPECVKVQCSKGYRSFDDLSELIRTYFPNATDKRVMIFLMKTKITLSKGKEANPHLGVCGGMKRIRFIPYFDYTPWDDNSIRTKPELSKYSWIELFTMIGITDEVQYKEYIKNRK